MNLLTTESQWHAGLQIADLIVGVTTAMCTPNTDYADNLWQTLKERLYRSESGNIIGCGLKIFPQESAEDIYTRLFPEHYEQDYTEYIEDMRELYSQIMSEDDLDINFPRF